MRRGALVISSSLLATVCVAGAQERTRDTIPPQYTWNLADLYPSDEAWRSAKEALEAAIDAATPFKGTLGQSAARLAEALTLQTGQRKTLARLFVYANLAADQDTRVSTYQGMTQEMTQLGAQLAAAWSFVEPELLALDEGTLKGYLQTEPRLHEFRFYLEDVLRRQPHTLSAPEEELIARTGPMAAGARNIAGVFLNADFPWPTVTLSDGRQLRLDVATYSDARATSVRPDRQKVMETFFTALAGYGRTLGASLNTAVQAALFETRARRYDDTLVRENGRWRFKRRVASNDTGAPAQK